MKRLMMFLILAMFSFSMIFAEGGKKGKVVLAKINSESLKKNLLLENPEKKIGIYLPPSYDEESRRYPVVYFLNGYTVSMNTIYMIKSIMDNLLDSKKINEMIIVSISGANRYDGSFYVNSPVTGNWEDFVVNEVVQYVDSHFRTLDNRDSRGIAGHSMGGFGAINLSLRHPEIYSAVYAMSPGLLDERGISTYGFFSSESVKDYFEKCGQIETKLKNGTSMDDIISELYDWNKIFCAYATAFCPDVNNPGMFVEYPYIKKDGKIVFDKNVYEKWNNGLGNLKKKIKEYESKNVKLDNIAFECGRQDEYAVILSSAKYLSKLLHEAKIPHKFSLFDGTHTSKIRERITDYVLPYFSRNLKF